MDIRKLVTLACALALTAGIAPASADAPAAVVQLANGLGTPKLAFHKADDAGNSGTYQFVPKGQNARDWTKMLSVDSLRVDDAKTDDQTRTAIKRFKANLVAAKAQFHIFDEHMASPPLAYFEYIVDGERNVGVIFSPVAGIVTIQQVEARGKGFITTDDGKLIKALVGYPN